MSYIDWDLTVDTIKSGKCILFLGPEVFTTAERRTLEARLLAYLDLESDPDIKVYQDGLYFFKERQKRTETYLKMRRFFQEEDFPEARSLFEKLARIPFHFIISLTPDTILNGVFEELKLNARQDFYWKKHKQDQTVPVPNIQRPLVYNMLGSVDTPESLVLTHDDLFDYFESILQTKSMPEQLKYHIINESQSIIFLGIPFDRWYMQLLLRVLHLNKDEEFMRFAATQAVAEEVQTFCKEQFRINFIAKNIDEFIEEIYQRCEAEGVLRQTGQEQLSTVDRLRELLAKDRLEEALQQFVTWVKGLGDYGLDLLDDVTLLSNRYRRLSRKVAQGIVSEADANVESNKIRLSMLELLREARSFE